MGALALSAAAIAALPAEAGTAAHHYVYTTLDPAGATSATATAVNDAGIVAGSFQTSATGPAQGFRWSNGAFTIIPPPLPGAWVAVSALDRKANVAFTTTGPHGVHINAYLLAPNNRSIRIMPPSGETAVATGVNDLDQVVGTYTPATPDYSRHGFIFRQGFTQDITVPGAVITNPVGITRDGTIAGYYANTFGDPAHGFLYANGSFQAIDPPNSDYTVAESINRRGEVTGYYYTPTTSTNTFGFVYKNGEFHTYRAPGRNVVVTDVTYAMPGGQVVGNFYDLSENRGFNFVHGTYYQILPPGAVSSYISSAADTGAIVGSWTDSAGAMHGFVAVCPAGQSPCTD